MIFAIFASASNNTNPASKDAKVFTITDKFRNNGLFPLKETYLLTFNDSTSVTVEKTPIADSLEIGHTYNLSLKKDAWALITMYIVTEATEVP